MYGASSNTSTTTSSLLRSATSSPNIGLRTSAEAINDICLSPSYFTIRPILTTLLHLSNHHHISYIYLTLVGHHDYTSVTSNTQQFILILVNNNNLATF